MTRATDTEDGDAGAQVEAGDAAFQLPGIGARTVAKLAAAGYESAEQVAAASADVLAEIPGIGEKTAEKILRAARGESASVDASDTADERVEDVPGSNDAE